METIQVRTRSRDELLEITDEVRACVRDSGISDGVVEVYVPHTTAGVTINENADPTTEADILADLDRLIPWRQSYYRHMEGNSAAHFKASLMGASVRVLLQGGRLVLGTWQGIFFCEFDGPRTRKVHVHVSPG
ncbi:MAG: secondary thiamine-phosphate synthase enzyme YjbQ [Anaerolineales bacterium]|jgi:secondary thiamine-phosphate synthase enzyme